VANNADKADEEGDYSTSPQEIMNSSASKIKLPGNVVPSPSPKINLVEKA
jgi:hypothetical protein